MIACLKASREQIWMEEEWHGRTHLCFLISEDLYRHFGPFLWGYDETPLRASVENGQGKSQMRITQRQGDVNRPIMIADGSRTLSFLPLRRTCPSCTILENIIRGKTERQKLYLCVFCKQCSLFYTSGSPFFPFPSSLSLHRENEEERSLCEMPRCSQSIVLLAVRLN